MLVAVHPRAVLAASVLLAGMALAGAPCAAGSVPGGSGEPVASCMQEPEQRKGARMEQARTLRGLLARYGQERTPRWLDQGFSRLASLHHPPGAAHWDLRILASGTVNAFASADGAVYLTQGLVDNAGLSPEETLAVAAHEMAHVLLAHAVRARCAQSLGLRYDAHHMEFEADRQAVLLLREAGMLSQAMRTALVKLSRLGGRARAGAASHPATQARIDALFRLRALGG